jgi:hypothetical protein
LEQVDAEYVVLLNSDVKVPTETDPGDHRFQGGEIGIKYIVNNPGDTRFTPALNADGSKKACQMTAFF